MGAPQLESYLAAPVHRHPKGASGCNMGRTRMDSRWVERTLFFNFFSFFVSSRITLLLSHSTGDCRGILRRKGCVCVRGQGCYQTDCRLIRLPPPGATTAIRNIPRAAAIAEKRSCLLRICTRQFFCLTLCCQSVSPPPPPEDLFFTRPVFFYSYANPLFTHSTHSTHSQPPS